MSDPQMPPSVMPHHEEGHAQTGRYSCSFCGVGDSGFGRSHGKAGFDTFSNPKSVFRQTTLFDIPKRFPPADKLGLKLLRMLMR